MRFVADESVDLPIVQALREAGYDVTYGAELAPGIDDATVLEEANREGRLLLTADKDFGEMVVRQQRLSTGVVLIRLAGLSNQHKATLTLRAIQENAERLIGHVAVVGVGRVRIRPIRQWEQPNSDGGE
jgi:predicted nuclease of predicted toxin-antitoxin system